MKKILKGFSYAFRRNIGWQDRTIRTIVGIAAIIGAVYFFKINITAAIILAVLALAQFFTVLSAKCIMSYFMGQCTISHKEKKHLAKKGIDFEK